MIILDSVGFFCVVFFICMRVVHGENPFSFQESEDCECGKGNMFKSRIVGGKETLPNEYPWMVAIFNGGLMHCGGSLINDRYVLTAGHCLKWAKKEKLSVVLGLHDKDLFESQYEGGTVAEIEEIMLHEKFTSLDLYDIEDIGLIKLKNPVKFNDKIRPICLPNTPDETYENKIAQVTGWGRTSQTGDASRYLKEVDVMVMSNGNCKKTPLIGRYIVDILMCAYMEEVDACQGDSGGPLIYETETGDVEQIGVVSWGIGCAKPGMPGIYVRLTSYLQWIASHTTDGIYCKRTN